jgi:hypothetical protein
MLNSYSLSASARLREAVMHVFVPEQQSATPPVPNNGVVPVRSSRPAITRMGHGNLGNDRSNIGHKMLGTEVKKTEA